MRQQRYYAEERKGSEGNWGEGKLGRGGRSGENWRRGWGVKLTGEGGEGGVDTTGEWRGSGDNYRRGREPRQGWRRRVVRGGGRYSPRAISETYCTS